MLRENINIKTLGFYYLECTALLVYDKYGILKMQNNNFLNCLTLNYNIYSFINLNIVESLNYLLSYMFRIASIGYRLKYELIGMGYRQYYRNQCIVFQLWYNHMIYKTVPFYIVTFKKKKKRKFNTLFGFNKIKINTLLHFWLSYRIKNIYTGKGMSMKGRKYLRKKMVKKLF